MSDPAASPPFTSSLFGIEPGWIDYNGHLNMGYYTVMFDRAADEAYAEIGFGPDYLARTGCTTYTAEFHIRYLRELRLDDRVHVSFEVLACDEKRFHTFQMMFHRDGWLAATGESLALHVDTTGPRVTPMPAARLAALSRMQRAGGVWPEGAGRAITMRR
ncbi:MAG: thioesterase family protein [Pseudomonadota bacterium]